MKGDIEAVFRARILPKAKQDGAQHPHRANLSFENSKSGYAKIVGEYDQLTRADPEADKLPLAELKWRKKRILELELMSCFLVSLENSDMLREQLLEKIKKTCLTERLNYTDRGAL